MNAERSSEPTEEQRLKAENLELATLAGGLAHEIRNPLSVMRMNLDLLAEDLEESQPSGNHRLQTRVQKLRQECENLESVLNDFLQFACAGQPDCEECSLNQEIEEFLRFLSPQALRQQVELRRHFDANLPNLRLDTKLIRQVLNNLARNALQAMPDGGTLEFLTRYEDGKVVLQVIDTGEGMSARTLSRIFNAFFSTRSGGSGLGLPTVRRIIMAHGGSISCESEPGQGTRFTIQLPLDGRTHDRDPETLQSADDFTAPQTH